jgi:hypothetical protein
MEKQLPQQGNIPLCANPVLGAPTGQLTPVNLNPNVNGWTGGKLADLPMFRKSTDKDTPSTLEKKTIVQGLTRDSYQI